MYISFHCDFQWQNSQICGAIVSWVNHNDGIYIFYKYEANIHTL